MGYEPDRAGNERLVARITMEEAVIAGLLLGHGYPDEMQPSEEIARFTAEECRDALAMLEPSDFISPQHRATFEVCKQLDTSGREIWVPTVALELAKVGQLEDVGGVVALQQIEGNWFTAIGITAYARQMKHEAALDRRAAGIQDQLNEINEGIREGTADETRSTGPHWRA